jgi:PAS domain S-box-containing protein
MIDKDNKKIFSTKKEWERAFASLPDMFAILDNQYRILRVNEAMAKRIGMKAEECIKSSHPAPAGLPCPDHAYPEVSTGIL